VEGGAREIAADGAASRNVASAGKAKGGAHSTANFRKAFARIYLLLHGGAAADINARLARLGLISLSDGTP